MLTFSLLHIIHLTEQIFILQNCKFEISIENFTRSYKFLFYLFCTTDLNVIHSSRNVFAKLEI